MKRRRRCGDRRASCARYRREIRGAVAGIVRDEQEGPSGVHGLDRRVRERVNRAKLFLQRRRCRVNFGDRAEDGDDAWASFVSDPDNIFF